MLRIIQRLLFFAYCLLPTAYSFSQPKLVVGIVVDQMRYDYIRKYWDKFGNDGFKRLVKEGFNCKNTNYNYVPTFTGPGHSAIYTGVTPAVNGIISNDWYDRDSQKIIYCTADSSVKTVGSTSVAGKMSPRNLLAPAVGEELRKTSENKSKVIGIGLKDRGAILPAGHDANAAYWYDASNGNWITSSYYMKALPQWVIDFNKKESAKKYLYGYWTTLLPIDQYKESDADDNVCEESFRGRERPTFPYLLDTLMKYNGGLGLLRSTPFGNSFTKDFAIETIRNENLGKGSAADMLCVSFSSTDYIGHQFGPQSVEVEDCYLRLDKDIAELLKFIDENIGKKNALVFLTSDHGAAESVPCLQKKNIPAGVVDEKTISDSLKKFYARTYNDSLLMKVSGFDVYLYKGEILERKLRIREVENKTVEYLLKLDGIADALTLGDIQEQDYKDPIRAKIKAGFYEQRSGDLIFVLKENWVEGFHKGTTHGSPYEYDTHVPLLWWGYTVKPGSSDEMITITQIASTLSMILKIPAPGECKTQPIRQIFK
jgi:predicted AlkP superfamily pyrophosphatase or phosphodiesterase